MDGAIPTAPVQGTVSIRARSKLRSRFIPVQRRLRKSVLSSRSLLLGSRGLYAMVTVEDEVELGSGQLLVASGLAAVLFRLVRAAMQTESLKDACVEFTSVKSFCVSCASGTTEIKEHARFKDVAYHTMECAGEMELQLSG